MGSPLGFAKYDGNKRDLAPSAFKPDFLERCCLGFENLQLMEVRGYANWEEIFFG